jgi:hypothetical protein
MSTTCTLTLGGGGKKLSMMVYDVARVLSTTWQGFNKQRVPNRGQQHVTNNEKPTNETTYSSHCQKKKYNRVGCLGGPVTFQVEEGSSARGDIKTSSKQACLFFIFVTLCNTELNPNPNPNYDN